MFQIHAARHDVKESDVRDVVARLQLEVPELGAAPGDHAQAFVRQLLAPVQVHPLENDAHLGRVVAEPAHQVLQRFVDVNRVVVDHDARPQQRVLPDQTVPAQADAGAPAQVVCRQIGQNPQNYIVCETFERRRTDVRIFALRPPDELLRVVEVHVLDLRFHGVHLRLDVPRVVHGVFVEMCRPFGLRDYRRRRGASSSLLRVHLDVVVGRLGVRGAGE